jgi:hypothetical protein
MTGSPRIRPVNSVNGASLTTGCTPASVRWSPATTRRIRLADPEKMGDHLLPRPQPDLAPSDRSEMC